jgi:predicted nucleic acid-binding protein
VVIYLVEEHPVFVLDIESLLAQHSDAVLHVSSLTEMECLVLPLRNQNQPLIEKFRNWFETVTVLSNEREVFQQAARLRADHKSLKTPDAVHLATAMHFGCDEFWTNDDRLAKAAPTLARNILTT